LYYWGQTVGGTNRPGTNRPGTNRPGTKHPHTKIVKDLLLQNTCAHAISKVESH